MSGRTVALVALAGASLMTGSGGILDPGLSVCEVTGGTERHRGQASGSCRQMASRFQLLFGSGPPPGIVRLTAGTGHPVPRVHEGGWSLTVDPAWGETRFGAGTFWETVVPHEMGHAALQGRVDPSASGSAPGQYGTSLPDWFDEAVAVWMEAEHSRMGRLRELLAQGDPTMSIGSLVEREHPGASGGGPGAYETVCDPECRVRPIGAPARGVEGDDAVASIGDVTPFYRESYALLEMIWRTGGERAVVTLESRYREGGLSHRSLLGLPEMTESRRVLEYAWRVWLSELDKGLVRSPD